MPKTPFLLPTKTSGTVVLSDLANQEIVFDNISKEICVRDADGILRRYVPKAQAQPIASQSSLSDAQLFYNFDSLNAVVGGINLTRLDSVATTLQTIDDATCVSISNDIVPTADPSLTNTAISNVTSPRAPLAISGTSATIAVRMRCDELNFTLFQKYQSGTAWRDFGFEMSSGTLLVATQSSTRTIFTSFPCVGEWFMFVWRYPNAQTNSRFHLRTATKKMNRTMGLPTSLLNTYTNFRIGSTVMTTTPRYRQDIDWFGVWHRELTDTELDTLWNNGNTFTWS